MSIDTQYTILLIEDDLDHVGLISHCFDGMEYSPIFKQVKAGDEALIYLEKCKLAENLGEYPMPRLILLDLQLPKREALKMLEVIKSDSELMKIPVVVVSNSDSKKDIEDAYKSKANSYLVKPYDSEEIKRVIRDVSRYWLEWNQLPG